MVTLLTDYEQQTYYVNSNDDISSIEFHNGDQVFLMDQDLLLIFDEGNNNWEQVPTGGGGGGGGGGGPQVIASGTFTGNGSDAINIPVGKKMPECDFVFSLWVPSGTEVTPPAVSTNRSYAYVQVLVQKRFQKFDLSTDGTKNTIGQCTYPVVNSSDGTTTNRTPNLNISQGAFVRYSTTPVAEAINALKIIRDASGFVLSIGKNTQYTFLSGVDYNWELLYIGSDPANDIVEVA